jgi:hypothetical protein
VKNKLVSEEALERSAVVVNCRMNRERNLAGGSIRNSTHTNAGN